MAQKNPYNVIKSRYVTEKSNMLLELHTRENNKSVRKCTQPKYVFLVDPTATKPQIARAVEEAYADRKVRVTNVNTINIPRKKRRVRGRLGFRPGYRKAIVTLAEGNMIEEGV